jgi:hypothetical protein
MVYHAVVKLEYEYNPVAGSVDIQIQNGFDVKVPVGNLKKPCIVEQMISMSSKNNALTLKCLAISHFIVEGPSNEYDIEELRKYVFDNGTPIAYKRMSEAVKSITGLSSKNPMVMPPYQKVMQSRNQ